MTDSASKLQRVRQATTALVKANTSKEATADSQMAAHLALNEAHSMMLASDLTAAQRAVLRDLVEANDNTRFYRYDSPQHIAARELDKLGLVDLDEPMTDFDEVGVELSICGQEWLLKLDTKIG